MKILHIVQKPQRRGAEMFARKLSKRLRAVGHSVRTAYLYPHEGPNGLPLESDDVVLNGNERHTFEKVPGFHPLLVKRLRRLIDEWQPDVVQVNGGRTLKYGAVAKHGHRSSWVLVYRSIGQPQSWVRRGFHRGFYSRVIMPRLDGVVTVSAATRHVLREFYGLSVPMVHIPGAVDPEAFVPASSREAIREETGTPDHAQVVLYVGSLTSEKRPDRLLRIFAGIRKQMPDVYLWIVGGGPLRAALQAQVSALSLDASIRFIGVTDNVASYMHAADILALTSDTEGMPGVVLEAGMLRRPTIATGVGGVSECVLHGQTGLVVDREDERGFVQALSALLSEPERLRQLGDAAGKWTRDNFGLAQIAGQYESFYRDVLAHTSSSARPS